MSGSSQFNQCGLTILSLSFAVNSKAGGGGGGGGLCAGGVLYFTCSFRSFKTMGK